MSCKRSTGKDNTIFSFDEVNNNSKYQSSELNTVSIPVKKKKKRGSKVVESTGTFNSSNITSNSQLDYVQNNNEQHFKKTNTVRENTRGQREKINSTDIEKGVECSSVNTGSSNLVSCDSQIHLQSVENYSLVVNNDLSNENVVLDDCVNGESVSEAIVVLTTPLPLPVSHSYIFTNDCSGCAANQDESTPFFDSNLGALSELMKYVAHFPDTSHWNKTDCLNQLSQSSNDINVNGELLDNHNSPTDSNLFLCVPHKEFVVKKVQEVMEQYNVFLFDHDPLFGDLSSHSRDKQEMMLEVESGNGEDDFSSEVLNIPSNHGKCSDSDSDSDNDSDSDSGSDSDSNNGYDSGNLHDVVLWDNLILQSRSLLIPSSIPPSASSTLKPPTYLHSNCGHIVNRTNQPDMYPTLPSNVLALHNPNPSVVSQSDSQGTITSTLTYPGDMYLSTRFDPSSVSQTSLFNMATLRCISQSSLPTPFSPAQDPQPLDSFPTSLTNIQHEATHQINIQDEAIHQTQTSCSSPLPSSPTPHPYSLLNPYTSQLCNVVVDILNPLSSSDSLVSSPLFPLHTQPASSLDPHLISSHCTSPENHLLDEGREREQGKNSLYLYCSLKPHMMNIDCPQHISRIVSSPSYSSLFSDSTLKLESTSTSLSHDLDIVSSLPHSHRLVPLEFRLVGDGEVFDDFSCVSDDENDDADTILNPMIHNIELQNPMLDNIVNSDISKHIQHLTGISHSALFYTE